MATDVEKVNAKQYDRTGREGLVSIIVPVYNAEKYLDKCIQSILCQTYDNFELILIDDGSSDRSLNICLSYREQDPRIVVLHQDNEGASAARNAGLDLCRGAYISFADSDDTMESNFLEVLVDALRSHNADAVRCNTDAETAEKVTTFETFYDWLLMDIISSQLWMFLFKRELWNELHMPVGRYAEDAMILHQVLRRASSVVLLKDELYHYNYSNPDNISNKKDNTFKNTVDRALMFAERWDWVHTTGNYSDEVKNTILKKMAGFSVGAFGCYKRYPHSERDLEMILHFLAQNKREILSNPYISKSRKMAVRLICCSPGLYYWCRNLLSRGQ